MSNRMRDLVDRIKRKRDRKRANITDTQTRVSASQVMEWYQLTVRLWRSLRYRKTPYGNWLRSCTSVAAFHWMIRDYPNQVHDRQPTDDDVINELTRMAKNVNKRLSTLSRSCALDRPAEGSSPFSVPIDALTKDYEQNLNLEYTPITPQFRRFPDTCIVNLAFIELKYDSSVSLVRAEVNAHVAAYIRGTVYDFFDSPSWTRTVDSETERSYIPTGYFEGMGF